MTTRWNGNPFRKQDAVAAAPPTRPIHAAQPFPYRIPPGAFPGVDDRRISKRFRPVVDYQTSTTSGVDRAAARQNASCFRIIDRAKRLHGHCIGPDGPAQRSTAQRSRAWALASPSRCDASCKKHGTCNNQLLGCLLCSLQSMQIRGSQQEVSPEEGPTFDNFFSEDGQGLGHPNVQTSHQEGGNNPAQASGQDLTSGQQQGEQVGKGR